MCIARIQFDALVAAIAEPLETRACLQLLAMPKNRGWERVARMLLLALHLGVSFNELQHGLNVTELAGVRKVIPDLKDSKFIWTPLMATRIGNACVPNGVHKLAVTAIQSQQLVERQPLTHSLRTGEALKWFRA